MKREHSIHVGNTSKNVSACSPSIHTTLATYILEKMEHITGSIVERKRKTIFIDADGIQLDLFGKPVLNKEFIMKEILSV